LTGQKCPVYRQGVVDGGYVPGQFRDLSETPMGRRLWLFLNTADNVLRMETACELGRPAIEAVANLLDEEFGPEIRAHGAKDRWKQMIGHMTRQVLERHGFQVDMQGVRVGRGELFFKGTRYRLTAAEMVLKLQQDLATIRGEQGRRSGEPVGALLKEAAALYNSALIAHPALRARLATVVATHNRIAKPSLRLGAGATK
jgi:hypothetical protein